MFKRLFGAKRQTNRQATDALYGEIVAAARQPWFYLQWKVPDTPLGRFEMLSLHMFLLQYRLHGQAGPAKDMAQVLIDEFFLDVDHSLRELGISDVGVPKRMKRLAKMYYGRTAAYADALERQDDQALVAALKRNICPDEGGDEDWRESALLAAYVKQVVHDLSAQTLDSICAGVLHFPRAGV
ncbi:ubiquinol-cytochrome C chaperone family protein [Aquamicrobium segne]|uniref:Ubiquinol-cytochrome C chaperone family protein n=1 Tax=Aquamicrobium segne TaxID=469547 RepID=A0ABW0GXI0_9HYPH